MTYRISEPLKFFQTFSSAGDRAKDHYRKAEDDVLRDLLRSALGETSRYRLDEGRFAVDATQGIVSRGLGVVGVPVRLCCPPEAMLLTLGKG